MSVLMMRTYAILLLTHTQLFCSGQFYLRSHRASTFRSEYHLNDGSTLNQPHQLLNHPRTADQYHLNDGSTLNQPHQLLNHPQTADQLSSPRPPVTQQALAPQTTPSPPPPPPPLSPEALSFQLKEACIAHRAQFDELTKLQTQLTLDLFFVAFNTPLLPAGGTLLGAIRHRMLCAPWDDDLDFNIPTDEHHRLLTESTPMQTSSKHVTDISEQPLGLHFAHHIRNHGRCHFMDHGKLVDPQKQCPKIVTLAIEDPGPLPTNVEAVFFHQYFNKTAHLIDTRNGGKRELKDVHTICLSLLFLDFGFLKVLAHDDCTSKAMSPVYNEKPPVPFKVTDIFPLSFSTYAWTCPGKDYASGVASKRCAARATYAQPIVTSTARMMTVENGGVGDGIRMLVPKDLYSKFFLKGNYGEDVFEHAMVCPHSLYSCYEKCAKAVTPTSMVQIRALMSEIPECYGYDGDGTSGTNTYSLTDNDSASVGENHVEEIITKLRDQLYLRVAQLSIMDNQEDEQYWKPLYYYEEVKVKTRSSITGLSTGVRILKKRRLLPAPGVLRMANFENLIKMQDEYKLPTAFALFWTEDEK